MASIESLATDHELLGIQEKRSALCAFRNNLNSAEEKYMRLGLLFYAVFQHIPGIGIWHGKADDAFEVSPYNMQLISLLRLHQTLRLATGFLRSGSPNELISTLATRNVELRKFREELCAIEVIIEKRYVEVKAYKAACTDPMEEDDWRSTFLDNNPLRSWLRALSAVRRLIREGFGEEDAMLQVVGLADEETKAALLWQRSGYGNERC